MLTETLPSEGFSTLAAIQFHPLHQTLGGHAIYLPQVLRLPNKCHLPSLPVVRLPEPWPWLPAPVLPSRLGHRCLRGYEIPCPLRNKEAKNPVSDAQGDDKIEQSLSFCEIQGGYILSSQSKRPHSNKKTFPSVVKADLTLEDDNAQSLSFHGIQGREDSTPVCSHQSLFFSGTQSEKRDPS